jgi:hypothetical protein
VLQGDRERLESQICSTELAISRAREVYQKLVANRAQIRKQYGIWSTALEAIQRVTSLLPSGNSPSCHKPRAETAAEPSTAQSFGAQAIGQAPSASSLAVANVHGRRSSRRSLFQSAGVTVPRPMSSFRYHRGINVNCLPHHGSVALQGCTPDYCSLARQYLTAEATKCGCEVDDIAWYSITDIKIARDDDSQHIMPGNDTGSSGECTSVVAQSQMLSFSTTFSSCPCLASFILLYLHISVELILSRRAMKLLNRDSAPLYHEHQFKCFMSSVARWQPGTTHALQ